MFHYFYNTTYTLLVLEVVVAFAELVVTTVTSVEPAAFVELAAAVTAHD